MTYAEIRPDSTRRRALGMAAILTGLALATINSPLRAQDYPTKPIRIIVPTAPGGPLDVVARVVAIKLGETFKQTMVVENKPGAALNIGADLVAKAPPDGYTLLMANDGPLAINPALYDQMPFDARRDFAPVTLIGNLPLVVVVNPAVAAQTIPEMIQLSKTDAGKMNYAAGGSISQFAAELFKQMTGASMVQVSYRGSGPALTSLLANETQIMFDGVTSSLPHIRAGKLRALAVTTPKRLASLPDVPTVQEAGVPGFAAGTWVGILAPAGTPKPIIDRLNAAILGVMAAPDVRERFDAFGLELVGSTPEAFAATIAADIDKWSKLVREANIPRNVN